MANETAANPDVSLIVVSFNTRELLRRCLQTALRELGGIASEVLVVDNASRDGSADMIENDFPAVHLLRSKENLGFAGANNLALRQARGRYAVLLNSDAFPHAEAIRRAVEKMDADGSIGLGGARLVGADGAWQPSARLFPSLLNDLLILSGLSARFPRSPFFGRADRTWADPGLDADVDWAPGAFSIIRKEALDKSGLFDEDFFLYYEEVDLCRRIKKAGYRVRYFADVVVTHLGGESSRTLSSIYLSKSGSQLEVWRMRSEFLYYRKHHGVLARAVKEAERLWHVVRACKNRLLASPAALLKNSESRQAIRLLDQAWAETAGGYVSPERPW